MKNLDKEFDKEFSDSYIGMDSQGKYRELQELKVYKEIKHFIKEREKELLDSLEDMVRQFAYEGAYRNKPAYITGGLSALEYAFCVLGWKEPHPCPENTCEWKGCNKWSHCGTPYKKGYLRCCGEHYRKVQELSR